MLGRFGEARERVIKHIIRQCAGDEHGQGSIHVDGIKTVQHPTARTKGETLAGTALATLTGKMLSIPFRSRRSSEGELYETTTVREPKQGFVAGVV